ncbi:hypothetical protein QQY24_34540 [Streptomyces sp. TG1A-8]|nr:hypothetical protein [Streptomyces sp. TG1A-8]MDO0929774.1 hypothetical protein [Streptomyces sp. TG1A-8]MDO0930175.1 hypothetical protein [Streptomyces sp. TG1A-8]
MTKPVLPDLTAALLAVLSLTPASAHAAPQTLFLAEAVDPLPADREKQ